MLNHRHHAGPTGGGWLSHLQAGEHACLKLLSIFLLLCGFGRALKGPTPTISARVFWPPSCEPSLTMIYSFPLPEEIQLTAAHVRRTKHTRTLCAPYRSPNHHGIMNGPSMIRTAFATLRSLAVASASMRLTICATFGRKGWDCFPYRQAIDPVNGHTYRPRSWHVHQKLAGKMALPGTALAILYLDLFWWGDHIDDLIFCPGRCACSRLGRTLFSSLIT